MISFVCIENVVRKNSSWRCNVTHVAIDSVNLPDTITVPAVYTRVERARYYLTITRGCARKGKRKLLLKTFDESRLQVSRHLPVYLPFTLYGVIQLDIWTHSIIAQWFLEPNLTREILHRLAEDRICPTFKSWILGHTSWLSRFQSLVGTCREIVRFWKLSYSVNDHKLTMDN